MLVSVLLGLSRLCAWFSSRPVLQLDDHSGAQSKAVFQPADSRLPPGLAINVLSVCRLVGLSVSVIASLLAVCCCLALLLACRIY